MDNLNKFTNKTENMSYEQAYTELENIILALETKEHSLDEALTLYERGQALIHHCANLLNQAELKIQQISGENLVDISPPS